MANLLLLAPSKATKAEFRFRVELEGRVHGLRFTYQYRKDCWWISFLAENGDAIVTFKGCEGVDLIAPYHHLDVPPGEIRIVDSTGAGRTPGRQSFRQDHQVIYTEAG